MTKQEFDLWTMKVARENSFSLGELLHEGLFHSADYVRNRIYSGIYNGKEAVLKIYEDPRITYEPLNLQLFNEHNRSDILRAPELYAYEIISPKQGWLIMQRLPEGGKFFTSPLAPDERKEFLTVFGEYRKNYPEQAPREMMLYEYLPPYLYHLHRLGFWFNKATEKNEELYLAGKEGIIRPEDMLFRYNKGAKIIWNEFQNRRMIWCHGHFKPNEVYKTSNGYWLIDFGHSKVYPEAYEWGFIVYAEYLTPMNGQWRIDEKRWKKGVRAWIEVAENELNMSKKLLRASLIERMLGTMLMDMSLSDEPWEVKLKARKMFYEVLDYLIESYY